ncbi:MAG: heme exporter protein CcmD [Alphaproteobacteria bacterium]|nr:heme exporter protein CcmD [Alphaproteobacteria bacterium]
MMIDLENPQAAYVLAAYGIAAAGLLGLLFFSWRASRRSRAMEKRIKGRS